HANEVVPTDRLVELLWEDRPPRTATHSIQIYVSELRKTIEPLAGDRVIVTRPPGYVLSADPDSIDARRFARLVAEATRSLQAGESDRAADVLRGALALWRGAPLAEFAYEEFAQTDIRHLVDLRPGALETLAGAELDAGRPGDALALAEAAIREDPLRERPREQMMLALYRTGRHAEALRTYQAFRSTLAEELGLDPSPALQRLQERILLHDPTLAPESTGPAVGSIAARNPYKGLRPFAEEDAADFFGRSSLEDQVLDSLREGARLVALVGPSGSGKSSVVAAGVVPKLRDGALPGSERWVIATMAPGPDPLRELEAAVARAASRPQGMDGLLGGADGGSGLRVLPEHGRVVVVIDQFEEVFTVTSEPRRARFLDALARTIAEPQTGLSVVLTLRADFYGSPLLHSEFARVFTPAVMNVLPMTEPELAEAVRGPADRVGVEVEPALAAQLIADTARQPGALPLLQYTLTELFEQRTGPVLTLTDYQAMGGLRGALSRRAEDLYSALGPAERDVAMQVFLRLVRLGRDTRDSRRRVPLSELTGTELDPVALSEVLEGFGRHRLLSFDRDDVTGEAIVEVAHEALLWEWDRLAAWIDRHRAGLRRHEAFVAALEEWEESGRDPDYLLAGGRLAEYEAWVRESNLQLTFREGDFLDASLERRRAEEAEDTSRRDRQRRLERRARTRLVALVASVVLLAGAVTFGVLTWLGNRPPEVLLLDSRASGIFGDLISDGVDRASSEFGIRTERVLPAQESFGQRAQHDDVLAYSERGTDMLIAIVNDCRTVEPVARQHPEIVYVAYDCWGSVPNVAYVTFAGEEGSFLAGAAAALKSETGVVGFIGGIDIPLIWVFQAGFEAGARAVDPEIEVRSVYLTQPPDFTGFDAQPLAFQAAERMYEAGADVIYHASGASGFGVFEAALQLSVRLGRHVWAIGVDVDQYEPDDPYAPHILTSMVKRYDEATYRLVAEYARGEVGAGIRRFDVANGGVGITYTGGFLDDVRSRLDELASEIAEGRVEVPCVPDDRLDRIGELPDWGLDPADPCNPA
ncbi:MAG TPA: BTAD domain-containing putative transcriptional regulator, partial [Actinomycetota bacterium]